MDATADPGLNLATPAKLTRTTTDEHQEIRDAVRAAVRQFPDEYHRQVDEQRAYPEEFVDALTKPAGWPR